MKKITISILSIVLFLITFTATSQTFTNYTVSDGLPHNNVNCLVEDASGNMWFGTQDGVAKFDGVSTWTIYNTTTNPGLVNNTINAIAIDSDDNIWVGTDFGACVFDGSTFTTYTTADGLGNDRINYIKQAANGDIWFGEFSGATVYDGLTFTAHGTSAGLPFGGINYIDFDSNDDVYMASGLGGFVHFDGSTFTIYNQANGLQSNNVRSITIDASDNKWVGTAKGISVFDNTNTVTATHTIMLVLPAPDTLNPVVDVKIDSQGKVWSGIYVDYLVTEGGVANYTGSSWNDYDVSDGLVGPVVRKIYIDTDDNVWVATSTGVSKISNIPTSINSTQLTINNLEVYPNPTNSFLNIVFENNEDTAFEIYNLLGNKVYTSTTSSQQYQINVANWEKGIYLIKTKTTFEKIMVN